jgi:hypothetical protein
MSTYAMRYSDTDVYRHGSYNQKMGNATSVPNVPDANGMYPTYPPEAINNMRRRIGDVASGGVDGLVWFNAI